MDQEKTCCFFGHGKLYGDNSALAEVLAASVEQHITEYGVTDFLVGNYGDFDSMAAYAVKKAKVRHPDVRLFLMLPYLPEHGRPLPNMEGFDGSVYPEGMEGVPYKLAIPRLNRLMVQQSSYAIGYVTHSWGGAAKTMEYAQVQERKGLLTIFNLSKYVSN
jgi:hypothetical protein